MHLQCKSICCQISGNTILSDIDLDVPRGAMVGLVGINGSGKSTLIRVLAGLRAPASGTITLDGQNLGALSSRQRATSIAHVGQEESPPDDLLLGEMVALGRIPHRPPWRLGGADERQITEEALQSVGLADAIDRRCNHLSGGERRRAMLARGLAQGSELLILDEPTNHLDIRHQIQLLETVRSLGQTVIIAMHDLSLAAAYFDQIAVLHEGTILTTGTPSAVLTPPVVEKVFGVSASQLTDPETGREHLVLGAGLKPVADQL